MSNHIIHLANGELQSDTPKSKVDEILAQAAASKNIVLHFHGGLVSEARGRDIAEFLTRQYDEGDAYPVFFVWEAGLLETIQNNLGQIAKELIFRTVVKRVTGILARKLTQTDGDRATGALPNVNLSGVEAKLEEALDALAVGEDASGELLSDIVDVSGLAQLTPLEELQLREELNRDFTLRRAVGEVTNGLRDADDIANELSSRSANSVRGSAETLMDPGSIERMVDRPDPASRGVLSVIRVAKAVIAVAKRCISRALDGRAHGLHATVVEEILREFYVANVGGLVWKHMKQDTADSFGDNPERHGGTAVLTVLNDLMEADPDLRITLVGHSTGAVYIAHMLEKADEIRPQGFNFDVVFLAPAVTFDLAATAFQNHGGQMRNFRIFTMTDENEQEDVLVKFLYPHSLLYFVSGVVEFEPDAPLVGMQRFYETEAFPDDEFPKVASLRNHLVSIEHSVVWSVTTGAGPGLNSQSLCHGDFDNDETTLTSLKHILKHGF
ncbi:alpha/beta hydrolase [Parasedimentitalea marina]|uniref:Alpha/beta hydrolase n=1 Tax=Parasedimentitalea marina TaxID=2483033 RepID=A0A3T0MYW9_9RHOB|nr:alpha/beta hydrolase [Parasedimentitalea marina]AZV76960.1 alpha/beta hydrolase [Parasedimentitalea marina]